MRDGENFNYRDFLMADNCDIKRTTIGDTIVLEEYINKDNKNIEMYCLRDEETKEMVDFIDVKALENSEYLLDFVRAHYINQKKINLSDDEVKKMAKKVTEGIADIIMSSGKSKMIS